MDRALNNAVFSLIFENKKNPGCSLAQSLYPFISKVYPFGDFYGMYAMYTDSMMISLKKLLMNYEIKYITENMNFGKSFLDDIFDLIIIPNSYQRYTVS